MGVYLLFKIAPMTKEKLKTIILSIGGKKKKLKLPEATCNVYVALLSQNYLS